MIPRHFRPKRLLAAGLLILAGCGGSNTAKAPAQRVSGTGFSFQAPGGWQVQRGRTLVRATHGSELVQVSIFPLQKPYTDALFAKVAKELSTRVGQVAAQTGGKVTGSSVVTAGGFARTAISSRSATTLTSTPSCCGGSASTCSCADAARRTTGPRAIS